MTRGSMNFCLFAHLLALFKWGGGGRGCSERNQAGQCLVVQTPRKLTAQAKRLTNMNSCFLFSASNDNSGAAFCRCYQQ